MDQKNLLNTPEDYIIYLNLYNKSDQKNYNKNEKKEYIPHNINYLNEEDQKKYNNIKEQQKDIIEEFINNRTILPLNDVLNSIDNENNEDIGIDCDNINFE